MNRKNVPTKHAIGVMTLGLIVFAGCALTFFAPYRDEASVTGLPALFGVPVWVAATAGMGVGILVSIVGIYYLIRARR